MSSSTSSGCTRISSSSCAGRLRHKCSWQRPLYSPECVEGVFSEVRVARCYAAGLSCADLRIMGDRPSETIPHSPPYCYRITHPLPINRPFELRINHSFAVCDLAHLGTIIRTLLSRTSSELPPSRSGGPAFLLPESTSLFAWTGAVPNCAQTEF